MFVKYLNSVYTKSMKLGLYITEKQKGLWGHFINFHLYIFHYTDSKTVGRLWSRKWLNFPHLHLLRVNVDMVCM